MNRSHLMGGAILAAVALFHSPADAQTPLGSAFTYQGELRLTNIVVDQPTDFIFDLFGQSAGGVSLGNNSRPNVSVARGVFTVELDFGSAAFVGDERWLSVRVRTPAGVGAFTTLNPRVKLTAAPHAQFAKQASSAKDASTLDGIAATSFVQKNEANTVTSAMIVNGTITAVDIGTNIVSSLDGVVNDGGNIDLVAGANVSITPNDAANTITIAASANGGDATSVDGLDSTQFLRADASDVITGNTVWTVSGGAPNALTIGGANLEVNLGDSSADQVSVNGGFSTTGPNTLGDAVTDLTTVNGDLTVTDGLTVAGDVTLGDSAADDVNVSGDLEVANFLTIGNILTYDKLGPKRFRFENGSGGLETNFSFEPALGAFDTVSSLKLGPGTIWAGGAGGLISLPAFNAFGSSSFPQASEVSDRDDVFITDDLALGGDLIVGTNAANAASSTIFFRDPNFSSDLHQSSHATSIGWDEATDSTLSSCTGPTGTISSALVFNMNDGSSSGWAFTNGSDVEFVVDDLGIVAADSTINASGGCDLAEKFLGDDDLEPGTLLRADPNTAEGVVPTAKAYDPTMIGVVSTQPAFVMNGPTTDALPTVRELMKTRALITTTSDADLERRAQELEDAVDSWQRGNVAVALVGRVPVLTTGFVKVGEPLTSSDISGHAMAMRKAGPSIGIALESKSTAGRGTVLVLVQPGWRAPVLEDTEEAEREVLTSESSDAADAALAQAIEERVLARIDARTVTTVDQTTTRGILGRDRTVGRGGRGGRDGSSRSGDDVVRLEKEAWGDYDADGKDDVIVLNPGAAARLYKNLGAGRFSDVTRGAQLGATDGARIALWHDVDQDERLDLLLVGSDGAARLLRGNGAGQFDDATAALGLDFGAPIVSASFLDHDHDGRPDLKVELADGTLLLHHNQGGMRFETVTLRAASAVTAPGSSDDRVAELEARLARMEALLMKAGAHSDGSDR